MTIVGLDNNIRHIAFTILKNHLRELKNWLLFKENKYMLLFLFFLFLLILPKYSFYFGKQITKQSQLFSVVFPFLFPLFIASKYTSFISREDSLLFMLFDKKDIFISKKILISFISVTVFFSILLLGIIPHLNDISIPFLIFFELIVLLITTFLLPYFKLKINYKYNPLNSAPLWNTKISNINFLPTRGIFLRDFFFLLRENKKYIAKSIVKLSIINLILILFIINNEKTEFFSWIFFFQELFFIQIIISYPTENNLELLKFFPCKGSQIIKGEFLFWFLAFVLYLSLVVLFYGILQSQILLFPILLSVVTFSLSLWYVLLIRTSYVDEQLMRTLIFILMFILPVSIPYYIYKSYKRIKC